MTDAERKAAVELCLCDAVRLLGIATELLGEDVPEADVAERLRDETTAILEVVIGKT